MRLWRLLAPQPNYLICSFCRAPESKLERRIANMLPFRKEVGKSGSRRFRLYPSSWSDSHNANQPSASQPAHHFPAFQDFPSALCAELDL